MLRTHALHISIRGNHAQKYINLWDEKHKYILRPYSLSSASGARYVYVVNINRRQNECDRGEKSLPVDWLLHRIILHNYRERQWDRDGLIACVLYWDRGALRASIRPVTSDVIGFLKFDEISSVPKTLSGYEIFWTYTIRSVSYYDVKNIRRTCARVNHNRWVSRVETVNCIFIVLRYYKTNFTVRTHNNRMYPLSVACLCTWAQRQD